MLSSLNRILRFRKSGQKVIEFGTNTACESIRGEGWQFGTVPRDSRHMVTIINHRKIQANLCTTTLRKLEEVNSLQGNCFQMDDEDYKVSSELYSEFNYATSLKPNLNKDNVVSRFPFTYPPRGVETDSDGDLVVQRKSKERKGVIEIEHSKRTILGLVGLQVWRGALLLADWLLHNGAKLPKNSTILELGSGTGLTSIVAAMYAPVICTDVNKGEILSLIKSNAERNKSIAKHPVTVMEIDFTKDCLSPEVMAVLTKVQVVLAADVVYDDELTKAFVKTVELILSHPPKHSIYVALEKRYVFTIEDCDTVAPCYEYFLECLNKLKSVHLTEIKLDFPQFFQYDRVKELVLWEITSSIT